MNRDDVFTTITNSIREVLVDLEDHQFKNDDQLADLGADSVDRSEIVMMTLEQLNLQIPLVETFGPKNIGELADLLHGKL